jgi:VIT1/CCC1 family predicted Fe2+/Mn2+ transporter
VVIKDESFAMKCGFVTFFSFVLFGFVTIFPYLVDRAHPLKVPLWPFVMGIASIELLSLGLAKAMILGISKSKAISEILLMGVVATAVGFSIGLLFPASS